MAATQSSANVDVVDFLRTLQVKVSALKSVDQKFVNAVEQLPMEEQEYEEANKRIILRDIISLTQMQHEVQELLQEVEFHKRFESLSL